MTSRINHVVLNEIHVSLEDATIDGVCATPLELVVWLRTWNAVSIRLRVQDPIEFAYRPSGDLSFVEVASPSDPRGAESSSCFPGWSEINDAYSDVDLIRLVGSDDRLIAFAIAPRGSGPIFETCT